MYGAPGIYTDHTKRKRNPTGFNIQAQSETLGYRGESPGNMSKPHVQKNNPKGVSHLSQGGIPGFKGRIPGPEVGGICVVGGRTLASELFHP